MSFKPVLPMTGYAGWTFLNWTMAAQKDAFAASPSNTREEDYFREKIGGVKTADALVSDRRLLRVALVAFGLESDIDSKAFIRKVLEEGTLETGALANRLADKRYAEFSRTFGFGDFATPATQISDFADRILERFRAKSFEQAVGQQNGSYRLAMNAQSELGILASRNLSSDSKWYGVLASKPLREVFQTALGLPQTFALIDVDRQLEVLKNKARSALGVGDPSAFAMKEVTDKLIRMYLVRAEAGPGGGSLSIGTGALQMLAAGQQSLSALLGRR